MKIHLSKINNQIVKPVPLIGGGDDRPIRGADLFSEIYCNIFICAKKKSGKTSTIFKIIKECADKNTKIVAFVSTLNKDPIYKTLQYYCDKKNITFEGFTSLYEDGQDVLSAIIKQLEEEEYEDEDESSDDVPIHRHIGARFHDDIDDEQRKKMKPRKPKYRSPEYIFLFDDLSTELKSRSLVSLLKKNRHFRCKCIISSQYLNDLLPESRKQMDYTLLFKGLPDHKLQEVYRDSDISIDFPMFEKVYKFATQKLYSFLYIDIRNDKFRINFNTEIVIDD